METFKKSRAYRRRLNKNYAELELLRVAAISENVGASNSFEGSVQPESELLFFYSIVSCILHIHQMDSGRKLRTPGSLDTKINLNAV